MNSIMKSLAVIAAALCVSMGTAAPAFADFTGNAPSTPPPATSGSGVATGDVGSCSLYASSGSFGLECIHGGGSAAQTVREIVGADGVPQCWDEKITRATLKSRYGKSEPPRGTVWGETCMQNLDPEATLFDQPKLQTNTTLRTIPTGAKRCKSGPAQSRTLEPKRCVQTLTGKQKVVVEGGEEQQAQIPGITLDQQPSDTVRTNEAIAYQDAAQARGGTATTTRQVGAGHVTMWAVMGRYRILPYGPDRSVARTCAGTMRVTQDDTPGRKPGACWWTYPQSSADETGGYYPFRAETTWTVWYQTVAGPPRRFATVHRTQDVPVPVYDIQTLVIN